MSGLNLTRRAALLAGLGASTASCAMAAQPGAVSFDHGVASGDPLTDRVVIWTRATPGAEVASVPLRWVVAEDPKLQVVVAEGEAAAEASRDYTAKVDVGGLEPGRTYHYGFFAGEAASPVGTTRTLPAAGVEQIKIAVLSCSNYPFGRFHAYADLAARDDVDIALHLGDYIYEYGGDGSWGQAEGQANGRAHEPQREIVSLDDYRTRYRQYRSDSDLQAAHAATSWILTWDDHELANNPWVNGAQNHNEDRGEGTWEDRKANALRAYFEWMPIRDPEPGRAREAIWRRFDFGDLATLVMLETRLTGRSQQLEYGRDFPFIQTAYKADENGVMQVVPEDQLVPTPPPGVERLRTPFDAAGEPVLDYAQAKAINGAETPPSGFEFRRDVRRFREALDDPDRRMIDDAQETWLLQTVADAEARGAWSVVGGQIIFARMPMFDFVDHYDAESLAAVAEASGYVAGQIERGRYGVPANLDAWDGYPVQRDRIADALSAAKAHTVFLAGDTHAFWANEVADSGGVLCAPEFGTTGVSSPGFGDDYASLSPPMTEVMAGGYPEVRFVDGYERGYLLATFTREAVVCDMIATAQPSEAETTARVLKRFVQRRRGADGALPALEEQPA